MPTPFDDVRTALQGVGGSGGTVPGSDQPVAEKPSGGFLSGVGNFFNTLLPIAAQGAQTISAFENRDEVAQLRIQQERARQTQQIVLFGLIILLTGFALWRLISKKT